MDGALPIGSWARLTTPRACLKEVRMSATTELPDGWQPADTAPMDGREFEYLCNDGRIRRGNLGHDLGGSIKRDPRMIGWRDIERREAEKNKTAPNSLNRIGAVCFRSSAN